MYSVQSSQLDDLSDADLIRRFTDGDDEALEMLLSRHVEALQRFCRRVTHSPEDAEDLCQESLLRAVNRIGSLQTGYAFRGWLFRIARNLSIDWLRQRRPTTPLPDDELMPRVLHTDGPEGEVEVGEEHQTVVQALARLKERHRTALVLREVEGLSYAEIARRLEVSETAVETLLFRARRRLRDEYAKRDSGLRALALVPGVRAILGSISAHLAGAPPLIPSILLGVAVAGGAAVAVPHALPARHVSHGRQSSAQKHVFRANQPLIHQRPIVLQRAIRKHRAPVPAAPLHASPPRTAGHHRSTRRPTVSTRHARPVRLYRHTRMPVESLQRTRHQTQRAHRSPPRHRAAVPLSPPSQGHALSPRLPRRPLVSQPARHQPLASRTHHAPLGRPGRHFTYRRSDTSFAHSRLRSAPAHHRATRHVPLSRSAAWSWNQPARRSRPSTSHLSQAPVAIPPTHHSAPPHRVRTHTSTSAGPESRAHRGAAPSITVTTPLPTTAPPPAQSNQEAGPALLAVPAPTASAPGATAPGAPSSPSPPGLQHQPGNVPPGHRP